MKILILTLVSSLSCIPLVAAPVDYAKEVAPIFRSYCAGCHNDVDYEGDFSLVTYASLREGGDEGDPIKSGDGGESLLIRLVEHRSKPHMPPKDEPQLPAEEIATLKRWIAEGASGPDIDKSILQELVVPDIAPAKKAAGPITAATVAASSQIPRRYTSKFPGMIAIAHSGTVETRTFLGSLQLNKSEANSAEDRGIYRHFEGAPGKVNALHLSVTGTHLIAASGIAGLSGSAILWEVESGKKVREFGGHRDVLYDAEISPNSEMLATAGYDRTIRIWNVLTGELLRTIDVHKGAIFDLAWHPSSKVLASASADETVKIWRVSDGVRLDTLNQPQGEQNVVVFTPDGKHVISAGADQRLHMWEFVSLDKPKLNPVLHSRFAHEAAITAVAIDTTARYLVSSGEDRSLKLWSLPDLQELHTYEAQPDIVSVVATDPRGILVEDIATAMEEGRRSGKFYVGRMDGSMGSYWFESGVKTDRAVAQETSPRSSVQRSDDLGSFVEVEPNDAPAGASVVELPIEVKGTIAKPGDADLFRFDAVAGQKLTLEVNAAREKSQLDSFIEVLHDDGSPVEQVVLQATRDSWLTFRGKDSFTSDDFRVHNWREMELDEYLYCNGEVVKLWHYPRGPDSGFRVYPGTGNRETYFSTTPLAHPLGQPCYTVAALPRGSKPAANGLPIVRLNYENDDDPQRRYGSDSLLLFEAPESGDYLARISDRRGFGGEEKFHYALTIRDQKPDFSATIGGRDAKVPKGGGIEFSVKLQRDEGFGGPVRIDIAGLPDGFSASTPLTVQAGQVQALGLLMAEASAVDDPEESADEKVTITATATINGKEVTKELGHLGNLQLVDPARLNVQVLAADGAENPVLSIRRGQTINARVRIDRGDHTGIVEFGKDDSGRNLPHGVFIDNIGLNGLMMLGDQSERDFQITASPVAAAGSREFHLKTGAAGGAVSQRVVIEVLE